MFFAILFFRSLGTVPPLPLPASRRRLKAAGKCETTTHASSRTHRRCSHTLFDLDVASFPTRYNRSGLPAFQNRQKTKKRHLNLSESSRPRTPPTHSIATHPTPRIFLARGRQKKEMQAHAPPHGALPAGADRAREPLKFLNVHVLQPVRRYVQQKRRQYLARHAAFDVTPCFREPFTRAMRQRTPSPSTTTPLSLLRFFSFGDDEGIKGFGVWHAPLGFPVTTKGRASHCPGSSTHTRRPWRSAVQRGLAGGFFPAVWRLRQKRRKKFFYRRCPNTQNPHPRVRMYRMRVRMYRMRIRVFVSHHFRYQV